jgi:two-component system sensor histidine kinase UhpB
VKTKPSGFLAAFWRGLSGQFFFVFILPLTVLILVVAFGSQALHHDAMRALVGDRDLRVAQAASSALNQELTNRQTVLTLLSAGNFDWQNLPNAQILESFDEGLLHLSADGEVIFATRSATDWPRYSRQILAEKPEQPTFLSLATNLMVIVLPYPQGGWLVGGFDPQPLIQQTLSTFVDPTRTSIRVVRPSDISATGFELIYAVGPGVAGKNLQIHPGIQESLNGQSGMTYIPGEHGELVVAYAPIPLTGWGLIAEEEWETISSPLLRNTQLAPLVLAPALLLALFALWYAARQIIQPLRKLEKQTEALSRGEFTSIQKPVGGIPEIQNLQAGLVEMSEELSAAQHSLRSYIGAITSGVENERRNLARELHDDTIQSMIALNQRVQLAVRSETDPTQKERLVELQNMLQQAMNNLRRMVRGLRPVYLEDLGLATALEMLVQETHQQSGLKITFLISGHEIRLDPAHEVSIYRIAQEAISNIVRHAAASLASVRLDFQDDHLEVIIEDDGCGFTVPENLNNFATQDHFGLVGLVERAEGMNAQLKINSTPDSGTTIRLILPIQTPSD